MSSLAFRRRIEDVKQHPLARLHPDRLAVPEHAPVDREQAIARLVAVGHPLRQRGSHRGLPRRLQRLDPRGRRQQVHLHVPAAAQNGLELLERQEHLAVVGAGFPSGLDVHWADLAAVLPLV